MVVMFVLNISVALFNLKSYTVIQSMRKNRKQKRKISSKGRELESAEEGGEGKQMGSRTDK